MNELAFAWMGVGRAGFAPLFAAYDVPWIALATLRSSSGKLVARCLVQLVVEGDPHVGQARLVRSRAYGSDAASLTGLLAMQGVQDALAAGRSLPSHTALKSLDVMPYLDHHFTAVGAADDVVLLADEQVFCWSHAARPRRAALLYPLQAGVVDLCRTACNVLGGLPDASMASLTRVVASRLRRESWRLAELCGDL